MSVTRILFIEPEHAVFVAFRRVLDDKAFEVDRVSRGSGGLSLLISGIFDLAVVNHRLPDMDGCELCSRIRGIDDHLPLLMLAPHGSADVIGGFEAGADDYLCLPVDSREFLARVRVLIKRTLPLAREHNKLRTGDIVLDNISKQVSKGGRPVSITASEFLLLEYLLKNKNRIVTRDELVEGAWRERRNKPGNLPAHMNKLRKKLSDGSGSHFLYTVSGKGYLLAEENTEK